MAKKKRAGPAYEWVESRKEWRKRKTIDGKQYTRYGKTKPIVAAKFEQLEAQLKSGLVLDDNTTMYQYAQEWYPIRVSGLRPKSAEVYRDALNVHIIPFFRNTKITNIKPLHVKKLMAEKSWMSNSRQKKILSTLSQIMRSAVEDRLIERNPCDGICAGGERPKQKVPLTGTQQAELVMAVRGTRAEAFTLLCLYAGLRRGEALGLLWSDVHLDTSPPYIEVKNAVFQGEGGATHSSDLKTRAARRRIPIPQQLVNVLTEARKSAKSVLVVPSARTGGAMSESGVRRLWEIATKAVDFDVHPHLLRHTYITELCAAGLDLKEIQKLAGHEDIRMTLNIYECVKYGATILKAQLLAKRASSCAFVEQPTGESFKL